MSELTAKATHWEIVGHGWTVSLSYSETLGSDPLKPKRMWFARFDVRRRDGHDFDVNVYGKETPGEALAALAQAVANIGVTCQCATADEWQLPEELARLEERRGKVSAFQ